jgi:alanyl-tRNA synthetase
VNRIEVLANDAVIESIPVETEWLPRDEAEARHGFRLYQGGAVPGKEIRVVKVGDWEVEACAGTHVKNTGEIGFIKILHTERVQDGVERLVYATGRYAVEASQENEKLLRQLSRALDAPLQKILPTTKRLLNEWKHARRENRRLIDELATLQSGRDLDQEPRTEEIEGLKLVIQEFDPPNIDRMIKTASKLTEKDAAAVALFYGQDADTARFVVMAGEAATKRGVNASDVVDEASKAVGGGGSGKENFAQGGGTRIKGINRGIQKARESLKAQLKRKQNR